jgi:hypothetical protein
MVHFDLRDVFGETGIFSDTVWDAFQYQHSSFCSLSSIRYFYYCGVVSLKVEQSIRWQVITWLVFFQSIHWKFVTRSYHLVTLIDLSWS